MRGSWLLALAVVTLGGTLLAGELVGVPGSGTKYESQVDTAVGGKSVKLALTGTALRTRLFVSVYSIGSYVEAGTKVESAESLASADVAKRLHLVMERTVEGKDMAEAFRSAIRQSYAEPTFNQEVAQLIEYMRSSAAKKGDHVHLTHVPGVGLHITVSGKDEFTIKNVEFSKAVWEIYLGKRCIGENIKKGLTSRL